MLDAESRSKLCHEYLTPVNHITGYSELLIEDAGARGLESLIPVFQQIHDGGRALVESIRSFFRSPADDSEYEIFKERLRVSALEILRTVTSLAQDPGCSHPDTLADLNSIESSVRRLLKLAGLE
jgi:signal transduction histidine kinase